MGKAEEMKARKLLEESDTEEEREPDAEAEETEEEEEETGRKKQEEPKKSVIDQLREITSGKLKLMQPFRAHSEDVTELRFDFCRLTNEEMMDALDSAPFNNVFAISNSQAMALFCATAGKCAPEVDDDGHRTRLYDAKDVKKRLGPADSVKAVQLAKLFYNASSQAGGNNISKE